MSNIELVVKIPEESYKLLKNKGVDWLGAEHILNAVANGTPLPEEHGKLVDAAALPEEDKDIVVKSLLKPGTIAYAGAITLQEYINSLPAIIESASGDKNE